MTNKYMFLPFILIFVFSMSGCFNQDKITIEITELKSAKAFRYGRERCWLIGSIKNRTDSKVDKLIVKFDWGGKLRYIETYNLDINARSEKNQSFGFLYNSCRTYYNLNKTPTVKILECKLEGFNQGECMDRVEIVDAR